MEDPRQLAFIALRDVYQRGAYTDIALDRVLPRGAQHDVPLSSADRGLVTELVYGIVRRQRSLDTLIDQLGKKKAHQQPPSLRIILHIGLYQLRYLSQIPDSAAVNTSVELAKENGLKRLSGVVNGLLRQYGRLAAKNPDPLELPKDTVKRLGVLYSFPDWIIEIWLEELGLVETEQLCAWFNQPPTIDLRVNPLRTTIDEVESVLAAAGVAVSRVPYLPQALRLTGGTGSIQNLPGFSEGWWTPQDSSAQLVTHLLNPQPGEVAIDACAAPGGKTTHIAEIMEDRGTIWACDRAAKRLGKLKENAQRLQLKSISICPGDSRSFSQFTQTADRVLIDAPCSGLGTLHRRPDIRWRQTPEKVKELSVLQGELLDRAATWVKPGGTLVYATCTLNRLENERVVQAFLDCHPDWQIQLPPPNSPAAVFGKSPGSIKVWPHQHQMDGFFMVKLKKGF
ncbi:MAG: 16S rRNA (cytosine(967)-C(5))-methyltransferase [Xenococcaceae cyanobacterium]